MVCSGALAWCQEHDTGTPQLRPNPLPERMCELLRCAWCRSGALADPNRPYTALQPLILAPNPQCASAISRSHRSRCSRWPVHKMIRTRAHVSRCVRMDKGKDHGLGPRHARRIIVYRPHHTHTHAQAHHTKRARFSTLPHLVAMNPVNGRHQPPL